MPFFQTAVVGTNSFGDEFRVGLNIDSGTAGEQSAQEVAIDVAAAFTTAWQTSSPGNSVRTMFADNIAFTKVMAYERPKDPTSPSVDIGEAPIADVAGQGGLRSLPPETAICVSLLTGTPGRSNHGRLYLPAPANTTNVVDNFGLMTTAAATGFAAFAAAWISAINGAAINGENVVVWSRKNQSTRNVSSVKVGNQFDTQSRRQNHIQETYVSQPVTVGPILRTVLATS